MAAKTPKARSLSTMTPKEQVRMRSRVLTWARKGKSSTWIASKLNIKTMSVAAIRAHESMGHYSK